MQRPTVILLVGNVKTGKSSAINALSGGLVTNPSKQRETIQPIHLHYSSTGSDKNYKLVAEKLEAVHKNNVASREKLSELKEEVVSKPIIFDHTLPLLHNLKPYQIIDTGGLEDADDTKQELFKKVVETNMEIADIVVFVSQALTLFNTSSETKQFEHIRTLIEKEKKKGHYLDLCVLVNKSDDKDDEDHKQICDKAKKKYPDIKFFPFSSHKFLINTIKNEGLVFNIPKFAIKEADEILKHANIVISKRLKDELKTSGCISSDNLEYAEQIDTEGLEDDVKKEIKSGDVHSGDWNGFIEYLKTCQMTLRKQSLDTLSITLAEWIASCTKQKFEADTSSAEKWYTKKFDEYVKWYDRFWSNMIESEKKEFANGYGRLYECISKIFSNFSLEYCVPDIKFAIFQHLCLLQSNMIIRKVLNIILLSKNDLRLLPNYIYLTVFYFNNVLTFDMYAKIFSQSNMYTNHQKFYSASDRKIRNEYSRIDVKYFDYKDSDVIHDIINHENTPSDLRLLLVLSGTSTRTLRQYWNNDVIPKELLDKMKPGTSRSLLVYIDSSIENKMGYEILKEKLFKIQDYTTDFDKQYARYEVLYKACDLNKQMKITTDDDDVLSDLCISTDEE